jgi:hypothetical protein
MPLLTSIRCLASIGLSALRLACTEAWTADCVGPSGTTCSSSLTCCGQTEKTRRINELEPEGSEGSVSESSLFLVVTDLNQLLAHDRVFHSTRGWGTVESVNTVSQARTELPLLVRFDLHNARNPHGQQAEQYFGWVSTSPPAMHPSLRMYGRALRSKRMVAVV